jgi:hypothetical protein
MPSAGSAASETELLNGEKGNSPGLSPLRTPLSAVTISADKKKTPMKEDRSANKVSPKDFFSSMKDIEYLFIKASDSGKEVPRMLEANKLHFRPLAPGKESMASLSLSLSLNLLFSGNNIFEVFFVLLSFLSSCDVIRRRVCLRGLGEYYQTFFLCHRLFSI